jgi:hypothetical protein
MIRADQISVGKEHEMRKARKRIFHVGAMAIALALGVVGCAGVTYQPVSDPPAAGVKRQQGVLYDDTCNGFRYYQSAPFLLVYSDGKGGVGWQIVYLPDTSRKMTAQPQAFLASLNSTLTYQNGYLSDSKDVGDATAVPKAVISAVEKVVSGLAAAGAGPVPANEYQVPKPHLYKIVIHTNSIDFLGGQAAGDNIHVTLATEVKP